MWLCMVRLSVNVNKIATLRNSRGGREPRLLDAVEACLEAGAKGITVHPRADERHIKAEDVREIARALEPLRGEVEFNIEGDPRPDLIALVLETHPAQCTLVPVVPGEITSQAGWADGPSAVILDEAITRLQAEDIRVSLFVDPEVDAVRFAAGLGADRVELYTEPFARAFEARSLDAARRSFAKYVEAANEAHGLDVGVNAGHDLDLDNLRLFRTLPHLDEVSIGHAIVSRAVFVGLKTVVREYLDLLSGVART
jgi:pyridoxine 5-phosphate synthase